MHVLEIAGSLIYSSHISLSFWGEAMLTVVLLINRSPSTLLTRISPYENLFFCKPDQSHLKVFGCTCFVLLNDHERTKLSPKSTICVFLVYGIEQKGYHSYDPKTNRLRISCNVPFLNMFRFIHYLSFLQQHLHFIQLTHFLTFSLLTLLFTNVTTSTAYITGLSMPFQSYPF